MIAENPGANKIKTFYKAWYEEVSALGSTFNTASKLNFAFHKTVHIENYFAKCRLLPLPRKQTRQGVLGGDGIGSSNLLLTP